MRIFLLLLMLVCPLRSAIGADMKQIFATWLERSSVPSADDAAMLDTLKQDITTAFPDPLGRVTSFYRLALEENGEKFSQTARIVLAALWRDIAPSHIRSEFLSQQVAGATTENELSMLRHYLSADLLTPAIVNDINGGEIEEPVGCSAERFLSTEAYRRSGDPVSARIGALLFELAPASVVLDLSEFGGKREVANLVEAAESARHRFEIAGPGNSVAAWEDVQSVLRRMLEMNSPALDGYVARIMAWRKNGPSLSNDPSIINTLNARNDPVVNYLLSGKGLMSLLEIESSQPALIKSANSGEKPSSSNGKSLDSTPLPTLAKAPQITRSLPTPSEKPTSSTPWSVILIVAAIGLLWLLFKNRK